MCKCIDQTTEKIVEHLTKQCQEQGKKLLDIDESDGDGLQGQTLMLSNGGGWRMKTDFVYRATFTKKDQTESRPKKGSIAMVFTFCPFCGEKYEQEKGGKSK